MTRLEHEHTSKTRSAARNADYDIRAWALGRPPTAAKEEPKNRASLAVSGPGRRPLGEQASSALAPVAGLRTRQGATPMTRGEWDRGCLDNRAEPRLDAGFTTAKEVSAGGIKLCAWCHPTCEPHAPTCPRPASCTTKTFLSPPQPVTRSGRVLQYICRRFLILFYLTVVSCRDNTSIHLLLFHFHAHC